MVHAAHEFELLNLLGIVGLIDAQCINPYLTTLAEEFQTAKLSEPSIKTFTNFMFVTVQQNFSLWPCRISLRVRHSDKIDEAIDGSWNVLALAVH